MRFSLFSVFFCAIFFLVGQSPVLAAKYPNGDITFYNTSDNYVTAEVSAFGKFTLATNEKKIVAYSSLAQVCSANPTNCRAHFYVNNTPAGAATINVVTGELVNMKLSMKVHTSKGHQNILRSVIIE